MKKLCFTAVAAGLVIAGCGGGGSSGGGSSATGADVKPATITVGQVPIIESAPIFIARDKGFFAKQKLTVKIQPSESSAALIPGVVSGSMQVGAVTSATNLLAAGQHIPIRMVAQASGTGAGDKDVSAIVVPKGSPVKDATGLGGKQVSVNALKSLGEYVTRNSIEKAGGDPNAPKYVEVPFPDIPAALGTGRLDAGFTVEPFTTVAKKQGAKVLARPFSDLSGGKPLETEEYIVSAPYLAKNRAVVARFVAAINEANQYASTHPDEVRKTLLTYTKIPPPIAKTATLPTWSQSIDRNSLQLISDLLEKNKALKSKPNLDELIVDDLGQS
jgi:NitT/TauT family transport system substrate-binding protein